jgi:hypothetical protein
MRDGPEAGLRLIDALLADGELDGCHLDTPPGPTCAGAKERRPKPALPMISASSHPTKTGTAIFRKSAQGTKKDMVDLQSAQTVGILIKSKELQKTSEAARVHGDRAHYQSADIA